MNQTPPTPASADDIDISALWRAVMNRKFSLLFSSLAIGALTFVGLSLLTPKYTSTARLIIESDPSIYDVPTGQQNQRSEAARLDKEAVISQVNVLRSNDLASDVIKKLRLDQSPEFNGSGSKPGLISRLLGTPKAEGEERVLRKFTKNLTVYPIKDSRVIAIDMTSKDPKIAASAANALANGFIEWQRGTQATQTKGETESLRLQLEDLKKQVETADFKLEKFRSETGLYSGQNTTTLNQQQLSEVNSQLSRAKAQKSEAEARARQIQEMLKQGTVDSAPDVLRSQLIQRLLEQRVQVQRTMSELSATLLPSHPRLQRVLAERSGITRQIRGEVRKIVRGLENEARIAGAREKSLRTSLDQVREQASKTGNDQVRLTLLEREATSKRTLYDALLRKFDEAASASTSRNLPVYARIFEKARVTSLPSFPQKLPMSVFATAASLLLGLAWVVTRALLNATRSGPASSTGSGPGRSGMGRNTEGDGGASYASSAPSASSPSTSSGAGQAALAAAAASQMGETSLASRSSGSTVGDIAETLLTRGDGKPGFRSIVTTPTNARSALPFGMSVGRLLAGRGARTIVISVEPKASLGAQASSTTRGLSDVLTGAMSLNDAVVQDTTTGVDLVEAGSASFDWSNERNGEAVNRLLDSLDSLYDQVLVVGQPDLARPVFALIEGRFDQGVIDGVNPDEDADSGNFLGYAVPEFHVATLMPRRRLGQGAATRAQFGTATSMATA